MNTTGREEVNDFLVLIKDLTDRDFIFVKRQKNMQSLANIGLMDYHVREFVLNLTPECYCTGPDADVSGSGEVWVFGDNIDENEIYIKLKADEINERAICISFHKAETPLDYPHKRSNEDEE